MAHLCEALALFKYKPAVPVLKVYVPKTMQYGEISRSAAIWALGQIFEDAAASASTAIESSPTSKVSELLGLQDKHDGEVAEELAGLFMGRVREIMGMPPESPLVRRTSALAIGRMRATSQLGGLKEMIGEQVESEPVEIAMRSAVLRMTGEDLKIAPPATTDRIGWFLEPAPTSLLEKPVTP